MILVNRSDSEVVINDGSFKAFRSPTGVWTSKPPPMTFGDLADEFRAVTDSDKASMLLKEAKSALSS